MDYGVNNYEMQQVFYADKQFDPVVVVKGKDKYANLYYEGDISLLMREGEKVKIDYTLPALLKAPIMCDTEVGTAKYYIGDDLIAEIPILTKNTVEEIDLTYCIDKLYSLWQCLK